MSTTERADQPTEVPTTPAAPTTVAPTTSAEPAAPTAPLVVMWAGGAVALHDPATGDIVNIVSTFQPEAAWVTDLDRAADGTIVYSLAVEDSWYSCDTSQGFAEAILPDGTFTSLGMGGGVDLSPDGARVALVRSSGCEPDPTEPMFVVVNPDTVADRSVHASDERAWSFPGATYSADAAPVLNGAVWSGTSLVAAGAGRLVMIDPAQDAVPDLSEGVPIQLSSGEPGAATLVGARADGTLLAVVHDQDNLARVVTLDPSTGAEVTELAPGGEWWFVSADPSGAHWVGLRGDAVLVDGLVVELQRPDPAIDDHPVAVGW
ncbi:MAG: hypothetical protein AB7R77_11700 [Ilumatobacteraceae bacterium]